MRRRSLLAMIWLVATACNADPSAPAPVTFTGTWILRSVNGTGLPYIVAQDGTNRIELVSNVITATATSFTEQGTYRSTVRGIVETKTESDAGSYTTNGAAVNILYNNGLSAAGTVSRVTFTVELNGFSFVFDKR
jgi:hypothetical protein